MPQRFVILEHHHEGIHYDLMLEHAGVLKTWRLPQPLRPGTAQQATYSYDHRSVYLDYEGPVSGNRGHVVRWDAGVYEGAITSDAQLEVRLAGKRCQGQLQLQLIHGDRWQVMLVGE